MIESRGSVVMHLVYGVALLTFAVHGVAFVQLLVWWLFPLMIVLATVGVRDIARGVRQLRLRRANKAWIAATEDLRNHLRVMDADAWYINEDAGWIYYVLDVPSSKRRQITSLLLGVVSGGRRLVRARIDQFDEIGSALNLGDVAVLVSETFEPYPGSAIMRHKISGDRVIQGDDHEPALEDDAPAPLSLREAHRRVKAIDQSMDSGAGVASLDEVTEVLAQLASARITLKDDEH